MKKFKSKEQGFTLVEVLVAIGILGLVAAPLALKSYSNALVYNSYRMFESDLHNKNRVFQSILNNKLQTMPQKNYVQSVGEVLLQQTKYLSGNCFKSVLFTFSGDTLSCFHYCEFK